MKVVYVAGPFRAMTPWLQEQNVRKAESVALDLWRNGFAALCPHTMTRFYQDSASDQTWIEGTLELMRRCDAVLVVGSWQYSSGTVGEITEALREDIPVYYTMTELLFAEAAELSGEELAPARRPTPP